MRDVKGVEAGTRVLEKRRKEREIEGNYKDWGGGGIARK